MAFHLSGNDTNDRDVPGLSSSDESEDEEGVPAHWILGDFPWGRQKCSQKSFRQQVLWWCQLPRSYRDQAFSSMKRLLLAPFLFQHALIPQKWIRWASQLDMIKYDTSNKTLPDVEISREHYLAVRMIEISLDKVEEICHKTKSAVGMVKMMYEMKDRSCAQLDVVIRETRFDERIKAITAAIEDNMKSIGCGDSHTAKSDQTYVASVERCALAGLLSCRQFSETLCIIASEGRDFAQEMEWQYGEETFEGLSEKLDVIRNQGNSLYTSGRYKCAYDMYSIAIRMSPFYSVLYGNRSQASVKMGNLPAAFCDAYRAVVLNPEWHKAYYKVMTCLHKMGYRQDALAWGKIGRAKCKDSAEIEALYNKFASQDKETKQGLKDNELFTSLNMPTNRKKTKTKKKKKKTAATSKDDEDDSKDVDDDEDVPPLVSDEGEWEDADGVDFKLEKSRKNNGSRGKTSVKKKAREMSKEQKNKVAELNGPKAVTEKSPEKRKLAEKEEEKKRAEEEQKKKDEEKKRREEDDKKKKEQQEEEERKLKEQKQREEKLLELQKKEENEKNLKRIAEEKKKEQEKREKEAKEKKEKEKQDEERRAKDIQLEYSQTIEKASNALMAEQFTNASKFYSSAIELFDENKTIRGMQKNDYIILLYARGVSSMKQMQPAEVSAATKYFQRIIADYKMFGHICMVFYSLGEATYLLNNFGTAIDHLTRGMQLTKKYPLKGRLTWPGTNETIPESDEKYLREEMRLLLQRCKIPPPPTVVCRYETCKRDYQRKQIYFTDVDFEGYFVICCDWKCALCFHLKCWARCKHDRLKLHGDKDVLGITCFTPDCKGKIISIKMFNHQGDEKNTKVFQKSPPMKCMDPIQRNKYDHRTSKSFFNLARFKRIQEEKKRKKKECRNRSTSEIEEIRASRNKEQKIKNENIPADQDLSEATVYMKTNGENLEERIRGTKMKPRKSNRRLVPLSLQHFCSTLPGYRQDMSMHEIVDAIEKAKEDGTPFSLPDDLREEIDEFEATLRGETPTHDRLFDDDERMRVPFLFEYFQDFFKANGPLRIFDDLFTNQIHLLPEDMHNIVTKGGGLVSFLNSSPLFVLVSPYIGIHSQHQTIRSLSGPEPYQPEHNASSRSSSVDLSPMGDFFGGSLSQFAKDFYQVGAPVEDIDIPGLTGGQELSLPAKLEPPANSRSSIYSQNSETSSMHSFEDDMKSEVGSQASSDFDKMLFKRPQTPIKKTRSLQMNGTVVNGIDTHKKQSNQTKKKLSPSSTSDAFTQTEGKDELEKAKEALERLQERLVVMEDNMTKLKRTSQTREDFLQKQLLEAQEAEKLAREVAERARREAETEMSKMAHQKKRWQDKLQAAKEKEKESQQKEEQARTDLANLGNGMQEDRENLLQQILDLRKRTEDQQAAIATSLTRATKSEIDLVKAKEMFVVGAHMRAKAESEQIVKEFDQEIARRGFRIPEWAAQRLRAGRREWLNNSIACQKTIETMKAAFASIVSQINNGRPLCELPPVPDLQTPPPGPNLRQIIMQFQFGNQQAMSAATGDGDASSSVRGVIGGNVSPSMVNVPHPHPGPFMQSSMNHPGRESPTSSAAKAQKKKNFQQLIIKLSRSIPELSKDQLEYYSQRVRVENGGLTGLLYDEIEQRIRQMVVRNLQSQHTAQMGNQGNPNVQRYKSSAPAPWAALSAFHNSAQNLKEENNSFEADDEESVCPICCDPLTDGKVHTLDCDHKFHYDCINKWMQKQRTCPNCRKFMADTGEFPALGGVPPGLQRD